MKASSPLAPALRDAACLVSRVAGGHSLSEDFLQPDDLQERSSRAALIDITHGTLRRYAWVQAIVAELSRRRRPDALVEALLWCCLYALDSGRYAEYTVVDQAVRACVMLERWTAKGYVNALLRGFLRQRASLESRIERDPAVRYRHPRWWIDLVRKSYPEEWEAILDQGNHAPPMCLRVNRRRGSVERYASRLRELGIEARSAGPEALLLEQALPVHRLPGFAEGEISIQDAGAQRAARCLELAAGQRVLDACAAPGGKAAHILESADVELTAADIDPVRVARLADNLRRLGLSARVGVADAAQYGSSGMPSYDRILADAPCSGSGVVRRHPDIKWLRRKEDLASFAQRQGRLLDALWRRLVPGGKLLYVTCSVFPQENDAVIEAFIVRTATARRQALADGGAAQLLPSAEHDGFYYALIEKST